MEQLQGEVDEVLKGIGLHHIQQGRTSVAGEHGQLEVEPTHTQQSMQEESSSILLSSIFIIVTTTTITTIIIVVITTLRLCSTFHYIFSVLALETFFSC